MSGVAGMRAPAGRASVSLRLPRMMGRADPALINSGFDLLERADGQNLKNGSTPALPAIILISRPGGIAWQLTVTDDGQLTVSLVPAGAVPAP